jgi:hypothetical protein
MRRQARQAGTVKCKHVQAHAGAEKQASKQVQAGRQAGKHKQVQAGASSCMLAPSLLGVPSTSNLAPSTPRGSPASGAGARRTPHSSAPSQTSARAIQQLDQQVRGRLEQQVRGRGTGPTSKWNKTHSCNAHLANLPFKRLQEGEQVELRHMRSWLRS